jgi:hypothetical protein
MSKMPTFLYGKTTRITLENSAETLKPRKACNDIFKAVKANNCQSRLLDPMKLSFKSNG